MELTRFDLKNQAIQERIAIALERIADMLEQWRVPDLYSQRLRERHEKDRKLTNG